MIATLPIGYADGLNRKLSNRGERAHRRETLSHRRHRLHGHDNGGREEVPGAKVYDEAVIIGQQGEEQIAAEEVAGLLDTISYEVLCNVSKRVGREYENF